MPIRHSSENEFDFVATNLEKTAELVRALSKVVFETAEGNHSFKTS